jgi:pilus assembly protein CpaF
MSPASFQATAPPGDGAATPALARPVNSNNRLADWAALRRKIHQRLLDHLDLARLDIGRLGDPALRPRVLRALKDIVQACDAEIPHDIERQQLIGELAEEALGLGPLEPLLADRSVSEIMVNGPFSVYVERGGKLEKTEAFFTDDERVRAVIERIVTPLGRRIDESSPIVDARLRDGSRVNAVIRPIAIGGACITIRKFSKQPFTLETLLALGSLSPQIGRFLQNTVGAKKNVMISGGTGSGKTTLLNILSGAIPAGERIVTIEDAAELKLLQPHVISMETKTANMEGRGAYTIRDLVKNALRMRPDRIIVGECRGGEALDMLQAMNTGHDGSLTTIHANSPVEALARLETLVLMAGMEIPGRAIREQISRSIDVIVQVSRMPDGSRKVTSVSEVCDIDDYGFVDVRPIFEFEIVSVEGGRVEGSFYKTGYIPTFIERFVTLGLVPPHGPFL